MLTVEEAQRLLSVLAVKERTMVLMALGTGLTRSELFALKWEDVDFAAEHISVTRSIVNQVVGTCKTEASQKPVPLHSSLAQALLAWRQQTSYRKREDWLFASPHSRGKHPLWAQAIMRYHIGPATRKTELEKRVGWHTFRHTYSTLLKLVGADIKVMQSCSGILQCGARWIPLHASDHARQAGSPSSCGFNDFDRDTVELKSELHRFARIRVWPRNQ